MLLLIFSHLQILKQELDLLIWREKKYGQYPNIMFIKLKPKTASILLRFSFLGTNHIFFTDLFWIQNTILAHFHIGWFDGNVSSSFIIVQSPVATFFEYVMKRHDIDINFVYE